MRRLQTKLGLAVLLIALSLSLVPVSAEEAPATTKPYEELDGYCYYAGQAYSSGACRGGQRCQSNGSWRDDATCPKDDDEAIFDVF